MGDCCSALQGEFGDRVVDRHRRRYVRRGPDRTTRWLVELLVARGVDGATVLDIGGGLGAVQQGLLEAGAAGAISVDASAAYSKRADELAAERGYDARVERRVADFVEVAETVPEADVVSLDRVICCYPDMERLVKLSAERARRLYGFVVPRHRALLRAAARLHNLFRRVTGSPFRIYVRPTATIDEALRRAGFAPLDARRTLIWEVAVYGR